jgi:hypothetical protein
MPPLQRYRSEVFVCAQCVAMWGDSTGVRGCASKMLPMKIQAAFSTLLFARRPAHVYNLWHF